MHREYITGKLARNQYLLRTFVSGLKKNNPGLFGSIFVFHWHFSEGLLLRPKLFPGFREIDSTSNLLNHFENSKLEETGQGLLLHRFFQVLFLSKCWNCIRHCGNAKHLELHNHVDNSQPGHLHFWLKFSVHSLLCTALLTSV